MDTPIFTPAACEGTTTLFAVPYFDEGTAYLTQSGQLYNEATAAAHGKVYCFGPTFRAEKSKTRRHLTEFWMVEPEMAFAHLEDAIGAGRGPGLRGGGARAGDAQGGAEDAGARHGAGWRTCVAPFPRLHYDDAIKLIQAKGSQTQWGSDFGGTDETVIAEAYDRPVVVHRFPAQIKAFYMDPTPSGPSSRLSADILAPEGYGEIVGGGERMSDAELLLKQASTSTSCPRRRSAGTWTCAATAACPTPASAWASSASSPGSAAWSTCGRRSPSRACCTASTRSRPSALAGCVVTCQDEQLLPVN